MQSGLKPFASLVTLIFASAAAIGCGDSDAEDGGAGGQGGTSAEGGSDAGGEGGGTNPASPFATELCNEAFCWEYPQPFGGAVNDLHAVGSTVWLAGEGMLARRDGGVWTAAAAPGLNGVWAASNEDVWAVGEQGKIVHWDGLELVEVSSPTSRTLYGIWGAASDDIWAVGDAGTIVHFDGVTWQSVSGGADELHAVWGSGPNDVYAVGGTLNVYTIAHYNGASWSSYTGGLSGAGFYGVSGSGPDNVIAVGEYGRVYRIQPNSAELLGTPESGRLLDVHVVGPDEIWVASDSRLSVGSGASWANVGEVGANSLLPDPEQAQLLLGGNGLAGFDENGPTTLISAPDFSDLWVGNSGLGVAIDQSGRVLTNDGGNWSIVSAIPATDDYALSVAGLSDGTRLATRRSDDNDHYDIYVVDGQNATILPMLDQSPFVLTGTSSTDIWSFNFNQYAHFNGSTWNTGTLPLADTVGATTALALGPNDVWVVADSDATGPITAHLTPTGWASHPLGGDGYRINTLTRFNGTLYASGSFTDYDKPMTAGFVYYPIEPVLFEWNGSAWSKVNIPGVVPEYYGSWDALVAASDDELYFATGKSHPGLDNLLVFDGTAWTARPYPATEARRLFAEPDGTIRLLAGNYPYGVLRSR